MVNLNHKREIPKYNKSVSRFQNLEKINRVLSLHFITRKTLYLTKVLCCFRVHTSYTMSYSVQALD